VAQSRRTGTPIDRLGISTSLLGAAIGFGAMQEDLAWQLVERIRDWSQDVDEYSKIDSVECAVVDRSVGLVLLWTQHTVDQGTRSFGVLISEEEIARYGTDIDRILADLRLMIMEPHGTQADENTRTWFRSLDGFIT
jgi:hypothetical protein